MKLTQKIRSTRIPCGWLTLRPCLRATDSRLVSGIPMPDPWWPCALCTSMSSIRSMLSLPFCFITAIVGAASGLDPEERPAAASW